MDLAREKALSDSTDVCSHNKMMEVGDPWNSEKEKKRWEVPGYQPHPETSQCMALDKPWWPWLWLFSPVEHEGSQLSKVRCLDSAA